RLSSSRLRKWIYTSGRVIHSAADPPQDPRAACASSVKSNVVFVTGTYMKKAKKTKIQKIEESTVLEQYDDIMTTEETCEALKVGYNTLYELLNSGQLKGYRNGRTW